MSKVPWDRWFRLRLDRNEGNERGNTQARRGTRGRLRFRSARNKRKESERWCEEVVVEEFLLRADTPGIIENIFASSFPLCVSPFDRVTSGWGGDLKSCELNAKRRERDKLPAAKFPAIQLGFWSNVNCFRYRSLSITRIVLFLLFVPPPLPSLFYFAINGTSTRFEHSAYTRCFTQRDLVP